MSLEPVTNSYPSSSSPLVSTVCKADLPALVEAELYTFSGVDFEKDRLARRIHPFRVDLVRLGIPAQRWPDFAPTIQRREKALKDKRVVMIKAEIIAHSQAEGGIEGDGDEITKSKIAIGMAWLSLPEIVPPLITSQRRPASIPQLSKTYLRPTLDKLETMLWPEENADGTDYTFLKLFKVEVARARKEVERDVLKGAPHYNLELLYIHPGHRRTGAGAALLSHCIALSESESSIGQRSPILLESTLSGTPLYLRFGFQEVYRSRITYRGETYEWPVMLYEPTEANSSWA